MTSSDADTTLETALLLKVLLKQRHIQVHRSFLREYDKVAAKIDHELVGSGPSKAQFYRWLSGDLTGLPYAHHCQVLERMFPDWSAEQLFQPYNGSIEFVPKPSDRSTVDRPATSPTSAATPARDTKDVVAVYPTRSEFVHDMPPYLVFDGAKRIRVAGLSLNLLCQNYPDKALRKQLESGTTVECLFLDPAGDYIKRRDQEEGHDPGLLSTLTDINIQTLRRTRSKLSDAARENLKIRVYDETVRFNITVIDERQCIVQAYLPDARGVEAPTIVIEKQAEPGLYDTFVQVFTSMWERAKDAAE